LEIFAKLHGNQNASAFRAGKLPIGAIELRQGACFGKNQSVTRAIVLALAVDGLRGSHHDALDGQALLADDFEEQRRADRVGVKILAVVRHVILIGRFVEYDLDVRERPFHDGAVTHVAFDEFDLSSDVGRASAWMDPGLEIIENADRVAAR
jgi:hypothetical protein